MNDSRATIMQRTMYCAARLYQELGWLVVPLDGKVPRRGFRLREVLAKETQTVEEVALLFPSGYRGNLGIVTGSGSGLVVVDLDDVGDARWARDRFGNTPFVVRTGKQGFHLYYRYPHRAEVRCRTRLWGRAIDLRACGGYVVSPPSTHPKTRRVYQWMTPFEQLSLGDMPEFDPAWLPAPKTRIASRTPENRRNTSARIDRARSYLDRITCVSGQGAHNTLFRACCQLADKFSLTESEMRGLLVQWNQTHCFDGDHQLDPWSRKELDHKISDSLETVHFQRNERNER